ncbi:hypothetical protein FISHEDRAFT_54362, partial [Fistulina hepatica ATCC 64428]
GAPPSYAFASRMYRSNLRPIVLFTTFLGALWALFRYVIAAFKSVNAVKNSNSFTMLRHFDLALGILFMAVLAIEVLGFTAAMLQRVRSVRMYAYLSVLSVLVVFAGGITATVMHFTLKSEIISQCTTMNTGDSVFVYPYGFWGPVYSGNLSAADAQDWCTNAWSHDSYSDIVSLIFTTVLAALFSVVAFAFLRQLLDPASGPNSWRSPSNQVRAQGFPSHYSPPYNGYVPNTTYNASQDLPFVPPYDADGKPPGYVGEGYIDTKDDKADPFSDSEPGATGSHLGH